MGLDQYLTARTFISAEYEKDEETLEKLKDVLNLKDGDYSTEFGFGIDIPLMYWRKASQIHAWFVANVQNGEDDCKEYELDTEKLTELRDLCCQVLDNNELAEELLPVSAGFFFGSREYDGGYFCQIQETHEALTDIIEANPNSYFTYRASW